LHDQPKSIHKEKWRRKNDIITNDITKIKKMFSSITESNRTCSRRIPKVAEPNLVGSSPFSARSYILHEISIKQLCTIFIAINKLPNLHEWETDTHVFNHMEQNFSFLSTLIGKRKKLRNTLQRTRGEGEG